jgi:hypothetical protein
MSEANPVIVLPNATESSLQILQARAPRAGLLVPQACLWHEQIAFVEGAVDLLTHARTMGKQTNEVVSPRVAGDRGPIRSWPLSLPLARDQETRGRTILRLLCLKRRIRSALAAFEDGARAGESRCLLKMKKQVPSGTPGSFRRDLSGIFDGCLTWSTALTLRSAVFPSAWTNISASQ